MSQPMHIIDPTAGTWFSNIGAFRLPHPLREGVVFESAQKYMVEKDDWIDSQPTLVPVKLDEDTEAVQMYPSTPGAPQFDVAADNAAAQASVDAFIADRKPELMAQRQAEAEAAAAAAAAEAQAKADAEAAEIARQTAHQTGAKSSKPAKPAKEPAQ